MQMLPYPNINPVIFGIGSIKVRWYGFMYLLGFGATYLLVRLQIRRFNLKKLGEQFDDLNFLLIFCVLMGGRLGYVLFYNLPYYMHHPAEIIATWNGGMSFHGALLALLIGGYLFCRRRGIDFWQTADAYIVTIPIGLGLGRIGNFINGELYGRVTHVPWAMVFPAGGPFPRHPSQLYECFMEGIVLFILLWNLKDVKSRRNWPQGSMLAAFLIFYGIFRFIVEFFRQPDAQLGFILGPFTMGQALCSLMIIAGVLLWVWRRHLQHTNTGRAAVPRFD